MKTYFRTTLRGALALIALLVCASGAVSEATAQVSPVGMWDCLLSGTHGQKGLAFLTFSDNGSNRVFSGFELLVANPTTSSTDINSRNGGGAQGRGALEGSPTTTPGSTLVGFGEISGPWSYDDKGRVVGYFIQLVDASGNVTNYGTTSISNQFIFSTNFPGSTNGTLFVTNLSATFNTPTLTTNLTFTVPTNASFTLTLDNTNFSVGASTVQTTNQISFVGKVSHGKHLTLKCSTSFGNATYQGMPYTSNLKDLTGAWQATRKQEGQTFFETFNFASFGKTNPFDPNIIAAAVTNFPNIYYATNNSGPGYTNMAIGALSSHKRIGFVFGTDAGDLRAALGSFSSTKSGTKANTKGIQLPNTPFTYKAMLVP